MFSPPGGKELNPLLLDTGNCSRELFPDMFSPYTPKKSESMWITGNYSRKRNDCVPNSCNSFWF